MLSGSRAVTLSEIAEHLSGLLGRNIKLVVGSEEDYVKCHVGKHGPRGEEEFLRKWATTYVALGKGELAVVDPLLRNVLGRELKPFETTMQDTVNAHVSVMQHYAK